jgi:hypothetical protein
MICRYNFHLCQNDKGENRWYKSMPQSMIHLSTSFLISIYCCSSPYKYQQISYISHGDHQCHSNRVPLCLMRTELDTSQPVFHHSTSGLLRWGKTTSHFQTRYFFQLSCHDFKFYEEGKHEKLIIRNKSTSR